MRIKKEHTIALVVDIQERLLPAVDENETILSNNVKLLNGLAALNISVMVTQQYTKGLGETVSAIKEAIPNFSPIEKTSFSCYDEPTFALNLENSGKHTVIISGIESHVCVQQTVIDLLAHGFTPVVIADCVSSRKASDKAVAIERMRQEGAIISTYESILFELTRSAKAEGFKEISKIIR